MKAKADNKTIWILWLQGLENAPDLVRRCVQSWRVHNPGWSVQVLCQQDVDVLWDTDIERRVAKKMPHSALANLVRMKLLLDKGGVWADSTLACQMPLDKWLPPHFTTGFLAFRNPKMRTPAANWFLACRPGNFMMQCWYTASLNLWDQHSVKNRDPIGQCGKLLRRIEQDGKVWRQPAFWQDIETLPYYWHFYLFDILVQTNEDFAAAWEQVPKIAASVPMTGELDKTQNDEEFWAEFKNRVVPFYKLNWRRMDPAKSSRVNMLLEYSCNPGMNLG